MPSPSNQHCVNQSNQISKNCWSNDTTKQKTNHSVHQTRHQRHENNVVQWPDTVIITVTITTAPTSAAGTHINVTMRVSAASFPAHCGQITAGHFDCARKGKGGRRKGHPTKGGWGARPDHGPASASHCWICREGHRNGGMDPQHPYSIAPSKTFFILFFLSRGLYLFLFCFITHQPIVVVVFVSAYQHARFHLFVCTLQYEALFFLIFLFCQHITYIRQQQQK